MTFSFSDIEWPSSAEIHARARQAGGEVIGYSTRLRPISAVRYGRGNTTVLVTAGVHGAERTNPAAAHRLIGELIDQPEIHEDWAHRVRLVLLPLVNPDGYELLRRGNDADWEQTVGLGLGDTADAAWRALPPKHYYRTRVVYDDVDYTERGGFDIGRDLPHSTESFRADGTPRWGFTREAHALLDAFTAAEASSQALVHLDLHSQRNGYNPIGSEAKVQWSTVIGEGTAEAQRAAAAILGGTIAALRERQPGLVVTRYPAYGGAPNPAIPSILSEVSGLPQEPVSFPLPEQIDLSYGVLTSALRVVAGLHAADPGPYEQLPETDRTISAGVEAERSGR